MINGSTVKYCIMIIVNWLMNEILSEKLKYSYVPKKQQSGNTFDVSINMYKYSIIVAELLLFDIEYCLEA